MEIALLKLYGTYRSRATRPLWLLGELGLPFELVTVWQAYRLADPVAADAPLNTRSPAFLKINPAGQIPAMDDGDVVLSESLAITHYLARKHGGPMAPASVAEEGLMAQWSLWAMTAVEPHSLAAYYHLFGKPVAERDAGIAAAAVAALWAPMAVLDRALAKTGYVVAHRFTVADINVGEVVRYALPAPELFEAAPHVKRWLDACHARPAFKAMMAAREAEPTMGG